MSVFQYYVSTSSLTYLSQKGPLGQILSVFYPSGGDLGTFTSMTTPVDSLGLWIVNSVEGSVAQVSWDLNGAHESLHFNSMKQAPP